MTPLERRVRFLVYRHFLDTARGPDLTTLAAATGAAAADVAAALQRLADRHALVLRPNSTDIWMAHPFSGIETAYGVAAQGRTYYANCAWDAAGVLSIVGDGRCNAVPGTCQPSARHVHGTDDAGAIGFSVVDRRLVGEGVVHFAVPPRHFWDDIAFT